jgi:hypothetical protein
MYKGAAMTEVRPKQKFTRIGPARLADMFDGLNGLCDLRVEGGQDCAGCPCDNNDECLLSPIKAILEEHVRRIV